MASGFMPGVGAGSDELNAFYGRPVPGVVMAANLSLALTYPQRGNTAWAPGRGKVNAGCVPTMQHACPFRIVFRAVADHRDILWSKKDGK